MVYPPFLSSFITVKHEKLTKYLLKDVDSLKHIKKEGSGTNLKDPAPNLGADQLQQMFPTPPSHEHPALHSPGDHYDDIQVRKLAYTIFFKKNQVPIYLT